jgi:hypothetical protein
MKASTNQWRCNFAAQGFLSSYLLGFRSCHLGFLALAYGKYHFVLRAKRHNFEITAFHHTINRICTFHQNSSKKQ